MRMSPLPPLSALVAFEAAVRHMSFTRAAEELRLSQSAISRQIGQLENFLSRPMFDRRGRRLVLTPAGETYASHVRTLLDDCVQATADVMKIARENELTLACTAGVATFWVAYRIRAYRRIHPELHVRVLVRDDISSLSPFEFDIAIYFQRYSTIPGYRMTGLLEERVFPVCSPDYLKAARRRHGLGPDDLLHPTQLASESLLDLIDGQRLWMSWDHWFEQHGVDAHDRRAHIDSDHYPSLIEMATQSQGIALGWQHIIDSRLHAGVLVAASHQWASRGGAFYLITPDDRRESHATRGFKQWLIET